MSESNTMKIVDFRWCKRCEHWKIPDDEEPCNDCLATPANEFSYRPIHFKEDEKASQNEHNF